MTHRGACYLLITLALLATSCQSTSNLNQVRFDQSTRDAAVDASPPKDAAVRRTPDAAMSCKPAPGSQCDLVQQCGCDQGEHCQLSGEDPRPTCVKPGKNAPWSACKAATDCPGGQTCDRGSCRPYCERDSDCDDGRCYPAAAADGQLDPAVKVCWKQCQLDDTKTCANGTACREANTPHAETASFCVAPFDPCPTVEDGTCDEMPGSGTCAQGTDKKDCGCAPKLADAVCDPVAQCGCADGQTCVAELSGGVYTAGCRAPGNVLRNAACKNSSECALGLVCDDALRVCVSQCASDEDCQDGACRVVKHSTAAALGHCVPRCDRRSKKPCGAESVCASFDARSDHGFGAPGDYCWKPLQQDCPSNGTCDEPKGSGICAAGSDQADCCHPPTSTGECDPVEQCGCASKPDTQCRHLPAQSETECSAIGKGDPYSLCADNGESCPPGYTCGLGACRKYCNTQDECGAKGNLCIRFTDLERNALLVGACFMACDFAQPDSCPEGLACARMAPAVSLCAVPYETCPAEYTSNGICDDLRPGGTRVCAMGTDPECG